MNYSQIAYEKHDEIHVIRFNRPEVMNCIGQTTHEELDDGLHIEAMCFNRSIHATETTEGLRQFNQRDHPDRREDQPNQTPGIVQG